MAVAGVIAETSTPATTARICKATPLKAASAVLALIKRPLVTYSTSAISKSAGAQFSHNPSTFIHPRTRPNMIVYAVSQLRVPPVKTQEVDGTPVAFPELCL